jgi:hypothetical protein
VWHSRQVDVIDTGEELARARRVESALVYAIEKAESTSVPVELWHPTTTTVSPGTSSWFRLRTLQWTDPGPYPVTCRLPPDTARPGNTIR